MVSPVHVVGYGNPLCGDDGVGVAVVRRLAETGPPPGVALFEGGVGGLATLGFFDGCRRAVLVDAMRTGEPPGTVQRLTWRPGAGAPASLHMLGVGGVLAAALALGS